MIKKFISEQLAEEIDVCDEVINAEKISDKECLKRRMDVVDIKARIEALKSGKSVFYQDYYWLGVKEGFIWAKCAPYIKLRYALAFEPPRKDGLPHTNYDALELWYNRKLGHDFKQAFFTLEQLEMWVDEDGVLTDLAQRWFAGWKEGVRTFWNEVADKP